MGRFKNRRPGRTGRVRGLRRSIRRDAVEETAPRPPRSGEPPPRIDLHRRRADEALQYLAMMLEMHRRRGTREVLVVHGRGLHSSGGAPVLGPLVRRWLGEHPELAASHRPAPRDWGGEGAVVVVLRRREEG